MLPENAPTSNHLLFHHLSPEHMSCDQAPQMDIVKCPELLPAELATLSQDISFLLIYVVFGPRDLHKATAWTRGRAEGV